MTIRRRIGDSFQGGPCYDDGAGPISSRARTARTGYLPVPAADRTDLFVRHDITDQIEQADIRQPSERKDPTENKEAAEPTLPTDSTEPTEPTESTDPREPMERTESRDHSDQREPFPVFDMRSFLLRAFDQRPGVPALIVVMQPCG
jgi:hypothetical protein